MLAMGNETPNLSDGSSPAETPAWRQQKPTQSQPLSSEQAQSAWDAEQERQARLEESATEPLPEVKPTIKSYEEQGREPHLRREISDRRD